MVDNKVEQVVYTTNPKRGGSFDFISKSKGITKDIERVIHEAFYKAFKGDESKYEEHVFYETHLKPGAKKNLFGKYKDSDYTHEKKVLRGEIKVIEESEKGALNKGRVVDYRFNPEKAPYRIVKCSLPSGEVFISRVAYIGTVYSDVDSRQGNYIAHTFILPKGVDLTNDQIVSLPFVIGLDKKYQHAGGEVFPRELEQLDYARLAGKDDMKKRFEKIIKLMVSYNSAKEKQNKYDMEGNEEKANEYMDKMDDYYSEIKELISKENPVKLRDYFGEKNVAIRNVYASKYREGSYEKFCQDPTHKALNNLLLIIKKIIPEEQTNKTVKKK